MDTLNMIKDTEDRFRELWDRQDADAKLAELDSYTLRYANKKPVPGAISVTMNDPAVLLNAIASDIMDTKWQTVVDGNISATQQRLIEQFLADIEAEVAEDLNRRGLDQELDFMARHICARGWIGQRRIWQVDEKTGRVHLEVLPVDMRWCSYELSDDGYEWVAWHKLKSPRDIKRAYGTEIVGNSPVELVDFWDGEKNEIWIDKKLAKTNKHRIGYPPFVIEAAPEGFMFQDKGSFSRRGESVFFLNRGLYPEYNRSISIDQTLGMLAVSPPYQRGTHDNKDSEYPNEPGTVYEHEPGEDYNIVPQPDIKMANRIAHTVIEGGVQRGGQHHFFLQEASGNETATMVLQQTEARNKILSPRLKSIALAKKMAARMDIDQFLKGKFKSDIGRKGRTKRYSASEMGDPDDYSIEYQFMTKTKRQEIANLVLFNNSRELPMETRLKDILMVEDYDGVMSKMDAEKAEAAMPVLFYMRKAISLAREAKNKSGAEAERLKLESILMTKKGVELLAQGNIPVMPEQPGQETKPQQTPMSLLTGPNQGMGAM